MPESPIRIRAATADDAAAILDLIRGLAEYERLLHEVTATEAYLRRTLFGETPGAEVRLVELEGRPEPVAFALFFHTYSTFLGCRGLYLEDLFVQPAHRGLGIGRRLLEHLAALAIERDCGRLEWTVLDWNEPALRFYRRLGAVPMDAWTVQRVEGEALRALAGR